MSVSRSLGRAVLLGLIAGMGLAAITLIVFSVGHMSVDCQQLTPEECTFELQISHEVARTQALGAFGLACIAAGLLVFSRRQPSPS